MYKQKIVVPTQIRVGYNSRGGTFNGKLAFMIYANKSDGSYGQQKSFDDWIDKKLGVDDIENDFSSGFVINKGQLNHYHFGASARFRVYHPKGFEFEISLENLSMIIAYTTISSGEINCKCKIGWEGTHVYLIPEVEALKDLIDFEYFDVSGSQKKALERRQKINNSGKSLSERSLTTGRIVETNNGERYLICAPTASKCNDLPVYPSVVMKDGSSVLMRQFKTDKAVEKKYRLFYPLNGGFLNFNNEKIKLFTKFVEPNELTNDEKEMMSKYKLKQGNYQIPYFSMKEGFSSFEGKDMVSEILDLIKDFGTNDDFLSFNAKNYFSQKVIQKDEQKYLIGFNLYPVYGGYNSFEKLIKFNESTHNMALYREYSYQSRRNTKVRIGYLSLENVFLDNKVKNDALVLSFYFYDGKDISLMKEVYEKENPKFAPLYDEFAEENKKVKEKLAEFSSLTQEELNNLKYLSWDETEMTP